jgi:tryptophan 2,3-dioxygenase
LEFRRFRDALFPASGFQSVQFRQMEILSADLYDLVAVDARPHLSRESPVDELLEHLYWRCTGTPHGGGKSPTLIAFEKRYFDTLRKLAVRYQGRTLASRLRALPPDARDDPELAILLRRYDTAANIVWPEAHRQLAMSFLGDGDGGLPSTGGLDWVVYLNAKRRHIRYFADVLSDVSQEDRT